MTPTSNGRRSALHLLRVTATASIAIVASAARRPHDHTDSFPRNDEYDLSLFDPHSLTGAPYGGWSRATRSRLAALPLRFVGDVGFEVEVEASEEADGAPAKKEEDGGVKEGRAGTGTGASSEGDDEAAQEEEEEAREASSSDSKRVSSPHHFRVRDGEGRPFVCRVYDEDELEASSAVESVFDAARLVGESGEEATKKDDTTGADAIKTRGRAAADAQVEVEAEAEEEAGSAITLADTGNLRALEGFCAQIQTGWWSYRWCHREAVSQFHVEMHRDPNEPGGGVLHKVEDVINIGKFEKEMVRIDKGQIVVVDAFSGGDHCEEAGGRQREIEVELRCCQDETIKQMVENRRRGRRKDGIEEDLPLALLISVTEQEDEVCTYRARVCTPLLCPESFLDAGASLPVGYMNRPSDEVRGSASKTPVEQAAASSTGDDSPKHDQHQTLKRKEEESIRSILKRTLSNMPCLTRNAGWWTYEFCHTRHAREYHAVGLLDQATGSTKERIESQHVLGLYVAKDLESYPDEKEVEHVVNATDSHTDDDASSGDTGLIMRRNHRDGVKGAGGNGAMFVQEYIHGDVCDHSDVTDAAIKGGHMAEGGIQRSTTVRFSCGKSYDLISVNEDSTCHYLFDVTVPALCEHPLFKAPVVKTQVLKCLPEKHK